MPDHDVIVIGAGFLAVLLPPRMALHDLIAGTAVFEEDDVEPRAYQAEGPAGFSVLVREDAPDPK